MYIKLIITILGKYEHENNSGIIGLSLPWNGDLKTYYISTPFEAQRILSRSAAVS